MLRPSVILNRIWKFLPGKLKTCLCIWFLPSKSRSGHLIESNWADCWNLDIWYDGFKSRTAVSEDTDSAYTSQYRTQLLLRKIRPACWTCWAQAQANELACVLWWNRHAVRAMPGSLGALELPGCTRIGKEGMDYKGFNCRT